jgi:HSP20 family protein
MTIIKRNQSWIPDVFSELLGNDWMLRPNTTSPAINILESETEYGIQFAAPGMTKEDLSIRIDEDNNLVVAMEKQNKNESSDTHYLRREFSYTKFEQRMILPKNADKEKISAKIEHGILNIAIPKLKEEEIKKNQKTITIQ